MNIRIAPSIVLFIALAWSYGILGCLFPGGAFGICAFLLAMVVFTQLLYRESFTVALDKQDLQVLGGLTLLQLVIHGAGLTYALGGDELFHAERATFPLILLRNYVKHLAPLEIGELRANMWHIFDVRHMMVIDIWRSISVVSLLLLAALTWIAGRASTKPRLVRALVFSILALGAFLLGQGLQIVPENHPPMRLLPLFASSLVFGISHLSFRIPGLVTVVLSCFLFYRLLPSSKPMWWRAGAAATVGFIPVVYYVTEAVEPSVYGFATLLAVLLFLLRHIRTRNVEFLIAAGLVAGCGMLFRQSTVVAWVAIGICTLLSSSRFHIPTLFRIFTPGLLGIPYIYTVKHLGHTATSSSDPIIPKLYESIESGIGPMSILNSTSIPWTLATILMFIYVVKRVKVTELSLFLLFIPSYVLFHSIWSYLWGIGRYQAEYIAPFIGLLLFLVASHSHHRARVFFASMFVVLAVTTWELDRNRSLDVNYAQWPRMRITTSASFPYTQALSRLKRKESHGNFVLVGGSPWYWDMSLWQAGFSYHEASQREQHQAGFQAWLDSHEPDLQELLELCRSRSIDYLVVQSGTRREIQHRSGKLHELISLIEAQEFAVRPKFAKEASYESPHGGILTLYRAKLRS